MIWNFCIRRPVFTVVIFLVIGIFGFYGYQQLPIREFPDVEHPVVSVSVVLSGAEPGVVETEVIEPLEEEINTTEGIKRLESTAREEVGTVTVEFQLWRDVDVAAQDVRDRVNRAQRDLPDEVEAPIIRKLDPDQRSIMWIALLGNERWDTIEMTNYADNIIQPRLESLRGVGRVRLGGERKQAVRIKLDHRKLAAHRLTISDVVSTVRNQNVDIPAGRIEGVQREFLVKVQGQFSGAEPFNDLIIAHRNGSPVRLRDLGKAVRGAENERTVARFKGEPNVGLGIIKQTDSNMVRLADDVRKRMKNISEQFPPGLRYAISSDDSTYVEENITSLQTTIIIATLLVVAVVLFFLGTFWGTIITSIAIPTSLLAGVALINFFGFSMNVLTMLGLILVIGIVVDDAIVVLESCYRHQEEGSEQEAAARVGTTEIAFAAIANTLSLGAVFIPVAFTRGMVGRFFFEFGVTVAVTIFASTFTALTLTPMLCSKFLSVPDRDNEGDDNSWNEAMLDSLESGYRVVLDWSLSHRFIVLGLAIGSLAVGLFCFQGLSKEFAPSVDKGQFMISFEMPEGSTLDETDQYGKRIESTLDDIPEVKNYFQAIGLSQGGGPGPVNEGIVFVSLSHRTERDRTHLEIMQDVRQRIRKIPSGRAYVLEPSPGVQGSGRGPVQVVIKNPNLDELAQTKNELVSWGRKQPELVGVNSNLKLNKPQVNITVNRDKASEMGITVAEISNTLRFILGEPEIAEIERGKERYEVITELIGKGRVVPSLVNDFYLRSHDGELVSMANLVNVKEVAGPSGIHHFNRRRAATLYASTPPNYVMGEALNKMRQHLQTSLPAGFNFETTGQAEDMQESFYYLTISLVFAVIFVYLVLAAQFESWLHPLIIMMTLPLAASGAFWVLYQFGMTFNVFTFIGVIMLVGLVTKNGILLIDYTNIMVARGSSVREAARIGGQVRFRPVLMTAFSTMLGMMPIALGYGAGGEARAPMGWSVVAGMFTASALTLVVIPVVYTLMGDLIRWLSNKLAGVLSTVAGVALLLAGGWILSLPFKIGLSGFSAYPLLILGVLLGTSAILYLTGVRGSTVGVGTASVVLTVLGVLMVNKQALMASYLDGLDPVQSGYSLLGLGLMVLVILYAVRLRKLGESTP